MPFESSTPFNDLPLLPPSVETETRAVLRACIRAREGLAALRQATQLMPEPAVLQRTLPLLETRDSSAIEMVLVSRCIGWAGIAGAD